jgi:hypothetical protein
MSAHPKTFERLSGELRLTTDPVRIDQLLDDWWDAQNLATNWDADQWGLNPDDPIWNQLDQKGFHHV